MSMIPVGREHITLGQALPWTLYDQDRNVVMEQGQVIATAEQLELLLAGKPLRELSWNAGGDLPMSNKADPASLETALADTLTNGFTFADMRLRVGDRIQLQLPASMGVERYIVKLIGYLDKASILVTAPLSNGFRVQLRDGDKIVARLFTSQKAFGFDSVVERICKAPYDYLHLSFPELIQGAVIRKSPRIKTKIIASVAGPDAGDSSDRQSAVIINLSADGALVKARQPLCEKAQTISLAFRVNLHNMDAYLTTRAIVRNVFTDDDASHAEPLKYHHGIQFVDLQPNDSVILQSLIYQQMIEQPNSLA
jgi:hypothetical protein